MSSRLIRCDRKWKASVPLCIKYIHFQPELSDAPRRVTLKVASQMWELIHGNLPQLAEWQDTRERCTHLVMELRAEGASRADVFCTVKPIIDGPRCNNGPRCLFPERRRREDKYYEGFNESQKAAPHRTLQLQLSGNRIDTFTD